MNTKKPDTIALEICVDSPESLHAALEGGAHRIELCSSLAEDGLTPSAGAIEHAVKASAVPVFVMVRPRGGNFVYTRAEVDVMLRDVAAAKALGAAGVVLGMLRDDGGIDAEGCAELIRLARPLGVTFHRAFDAARDPFDALEALVKLGVDRVLTSGRARTAEEGIETLRKLVQRAQGRIAVTPGGGVTGENARRIIERTGATDLHASARGPREGGVSRTDAARVRAILAALGIN